MEGPEGPEGSGIVRPDAAMDAAGEVDEAASGEAPAPRARRGDYAGEPDEYVAWAPNDDGRPVDCRFLRMIMPDGRLGRAGTYADPNHRCVAFGEPLALSTRQQQLVCLASVHVSCPRYLRGTLLAGESGREDGRRGRRMPVSIAASLVLLVVSIVVSFVAFASGAVRLPGESEFGASLAADVSTPSPSISASLATASVSTSASPKVTATPTPTPAPSPTPSPTPTAVPTPSPSASPTAAPTPTARPSQTWPPGATASRMNLVTPCTDGSGCWVYVVRHNDKFYEITYFFGVNSQTVRRMNPWLTSISSMEPWVGRSLVIPPPTK